MKRNDLGIDLRLTFTLLFLSSPFIFFRKRNSRVSIVSVLSVTVLLHCSIPLWIFWYSLQLILEKLLTKLVWYVHCKQSVTLSCCAVAFDTTTMKPQTQKSYFSTTNFIASAVLLLFTMKCPQSLLCCIAFNSLQG